jgi:hypothetical protein
MQLGAGTISGLPFQQAQAVKEPATLRALTQRRHARKLKPPIRCRVTSTCWLHDSKLSPQSRWSSMFVPPTVGRARDGSTDPVPFLAAQ